MLTTRSFIERHALVIGILLMFLLTWPIDLANAGVLPFKIPFVLAILVGWGFVLASLFMTWLTLGKEGVFALLKRFLLWRLDWKWYLVAFLLIPSISLLGIWLNAVISQTPIDFNTLLAYQLFGTSANVPLLILPFFLFDAIANGEEMGWRGYVLPRLQLKHSALVSTLILGVIWSMWHIPKFLSHWSLAVFAWFVVGMIAKAVLLTWMYNNTKGSLLLVTLFHASFNTAAVFLPIANNVSDGNSNIRIITGLLEVLVAFVVILSAGPEHLSRTGSKEKQARLAPAGQPLAAK